MEGVAWGAEMKVNWVTDNYQISNLLLTNIQQRTHFLVTNVAILASLPHKWSDTLFMAYPVLNTPLSRHRFIMCTCWLLNPPAASMYVARVWP